MRSQDPSEEKDTLLLQRAAELGEAIKQCAFVERELEEAKALELKLQSEKNEAAQALNRRLGSVADEINKARISREVSESDLASTTGLVQMAERCKAIERRLEEAKAQQTRLVEKRAALVQNLDRHFGTVAQESQSVQKALQAARVELARKTAALSKAENDLNQHRLRHEQITSQLKNANTSLAEAKKREQEAQLRISEISGENKAHKDTLEAQSKLLQREKAEKETVFAFLKGSEEKLQEANTKATRERENLSAQLERAIQRTTELKQNAQTREMELRSELEGVRTKLQSALSQIRDLEGLHSQREKLSAQVARLSDELAREKDQTQDLVRRSHDADRMIRELKSAEARLAEECTSLKISKTQLESALAAETRQLSELRRRLKEFELNDNREALEKEKRALENQNSRLSYELEISRETAMQKERQILDLVSKLDASERKVASATEGARERIDQRISSIEGLLSELGDQVKSVSVMQVPRIDDQLAQLSRAMEKTAEEKEALRAETGVLQREIETLRKTQPLRALLKVKETEIAKVDRELKNLTPGSFEYKKLAALSAMLLEQREQVLKIISSAEGEPGTKPASKQTKSAKKAAPEPPPFRDKSLN